MNSQGEISKLNESWADELPLVLWSYRMSFRTTTGETPFSLSYSVDVIVLIELIVPTYRIENFDESYNDQLLALEINLLEEKQNRAQVQATTL